MANDNNKLLVIIVTFNGMKWLQECLESVRNSTAKTDLFIVDNGSTDGSIEFIKTHYPDAIFIESKENLGFGRANNLGLEYALKNGYNYVYLLNQDAWIEKNLLDKLISISKENPEYGIISPLQVNKEKNRLDRSFLNSIPPELSSDILCLKRTNEIYECSWVMAAHWLITKDCLKTIGGFSPAFPHYGEDDNYINRVQYKGYKIGIVPDCKGVHDREHRPVSLDKKKYLQYIHQLVLFNNPFVTHRFLKGIKRYLLLLISNPKEFPWKYLKATVVGYIRSNKYQKEALKAGAFLS